jgi:protein-serine/threonine kinase
MSAISATSYELPPRRPWDPARLSQSTSPQHQSDGTDPDKFARDDPWVKGKIIKGHPNICPLLDFFEDDHYYYLVLPSTIPEQKPHEPSPASDLFDLIENFPQGLQPSSIRSYLGQLADALCFLHSLGIGEYLIHFVDLFMLTIA